ncbi:hypothetical protein DUI87_33962 [Hirundo rustica rustica]|uniref:Uncharacterized protein n=1 Tax=Hirundo rustica rustica TaxID=333673 RepID=A0A3M0IGY3_HIRRU|nr:hypothetical protein DUI87_35602 [Hirundo rustica rustica]RMB89639.1 hypothetical protein DUI87_33962 [Hirundo rustica rustica]
MPVNQERGTGDSCCRPPSPDAVPLLDELEEGLEDGPVPPPAEPLAEPTTGLKELTEQIQVVMQRLDERAHAAAELLSTTTVTGQDEPTSFSSQLTPMQRLLEQTAESSSQATPLPAPPVTRWSRIIGAVGKNASTLAGTSVLSPFLHIGSVIALAAMIDKKSAVQLFERHLCLFILTFGFVAAKITNQLVIAHMTKSEMYLYNTAFISPALRFLDQMF